MQAMPVMRSVSRLSGQAHRNKEDKELYADFLININKTFGEDWSLHTPLLCTTLNVVSETSTVSMRLPSMVM